MATSLGETETPIKNERLMELKEYIEEYGIDIRAFALKAGISDDTIYRIINHGHTPSRITARKISEITEGVVTIKELRDIFKHRRQPQ